MDKKSKFIAKSYVAKWLIAELIKPSQAMNLISKVSNDQFKDLEDFVYYAVTTCRNKKENRSAIEYDNIPAEYQKHQSLLHKLVFKHSSDPCKMLSIIKNRDEKMYKESILHMMTRAETINLIRKEGLLCDTEKIETEELKKFLNSHI